MKFIDNQKQKKAEKYVHYITKQLNRYRKNQVFACKGTILYFDQCRKSVDLRQLFDEKVPDYEIIRDFEKVVREMDIRENEQEQMSLYPTK